MPYTIKIDRERQRALFKASGTVTQTDAFQSIQDLISHPDFRPGCDVLVDMTEVEEVLLMGADIRAKVGFDSALLDAVGAANWAFVAPTDAVFGLARMYQTMMETTPINVGTFRDLAAGQAWLDGR